MRSIIKIGIYIAVGVGVGYFVLNQSQETQRVLVAVMWAVLFYWRLGDIHTALDSLNANLTEVSNNTNRTNVLLDELKEEE